MQAEQAQQAPEQSLSREEFNSPGSPPAQQADGNSAASNWEQRYKGVHKKVVEPMQQELAATQSEKQALEASLASMQERFAKLETQLSQLAEENKGLKTTTQQTAAQLERAKVLAKHGFGDLLEEGEDGTVQLPDLSSTEGLEGFLARLSQQRAQSAEQMSAQATELARQMVDSALEGTTVGPLRRSDLNPAQEAEYHDEMARTLYAQGKVDEGDKHMNRLNELWGEYADDLGIERLRPSQFGRSL